MADSIKKLTELFAKFPSIGPRTAGRFVFYVLKLPPQKIDELVTAINEVKNNIKLCNFCFNPYENSGNLCEICQNNSRSKQLLCIVEKEADLLTIENTKRYKGLYFILGGTISAFKSTTNDHLRIKDLQERIKNPSAFSVAPFAEIIIATNPTPEGKATSMLVERALKELPQSPSFKVTRLAQGLPVGGELEYADDETLESAFEGRKGI